MAADPNPELRAELEAALAVIEPQIRGLNDLLNVSISGELAASIRGELAEREHRRDLIVAAIACLDALQAAMDALEADGYPALPPATIIASQYAELQGQASDLTTAVAVFDEQASQLTVGLGTPAAKPAAP
jgi:hypothetical protein